MDIFNQYIEPIIHWLHLHPHWAGIITFLVSFSESLAIVGTIVPGSVTMTAIGVLIGSGVIPFYSTFTWAVLGAIAGDSGSYFLGYYYHMQIAEYWPFRRYPNILTKGKSFFILHGGKSVFLGRFLGPLRSIIPVIAGIMHMSNARFLFANITSAFLWAVLYIAPGMVIGAATSELSAESASKLLFYIFISLIGIWLLTWIFKACITAIKKFTVKHLNQFWVWMRTHPKLQAIALWLSDPSEPHSLTQLYLTLLAFLSFVVFILVIRSTMHHGVITHYNTAFFHLLQSIRFPISNKFFTFITFFGDKLVILPLSFIVIICLYYGRHRWAAIHLLSLTFFTSIFVLVSKHFVHFSRPTGLVAVRHGFSFPSGHTAITFSVIGFIAFLLSKQTTLSMRRFIWCPTLSFFILLGFSRIYLGAHWISDLFGALSLIGFLLLGHIVSYQRKSSASISIPHLASLTIILLILGGSFLNYRYFSQTLNNSELKHTIHTISLSTWWDGDKNIFPLYRNNRLGKPINRLNIQWAAPLTEIQSVLSSEGWIEHEDISISNLISNYITKSPLNRLPLLNPLYLNQRPVLTMSFKEKNKPLMILNLWPSLYKFESANIPLWVGSLYRRVDDTHHGHFLNHTFIRNDNIQNPDKIFDNSLEYFVWKKIPSDNHQASILLIKKR